MKKLFDYFLKNKSLSECKTSLMISLLRLFAGIMMLPYGVGKIENFDTLSVDFFNDPIGIGMYPSLILTIFAQVICAVALCIGLFSRPAAAVLAFNMLVASKYHLFDDFATLSLPLLFLGIYCFLTIVGGGKYSVDSLLFNKKKK